MFHVTFNVVHAGQHSCTVATTPPVDNQSNCETLVLLCNTILWDKHEIDMPRDNENPNNTSHDVEKTLLNDSPFPMIGLFQ